MTNLNLITAAAESLSALADSVEQFRRTFEVSRGMSQDLPNAFGCSEAEAFADLLDALGLSDFADDFRQTHDEGEENEGCEHSWNDEYDERDDEDPGTPGPGALPHG